MDPREIDSSLYASFCEACDSRQRHIEEVLDGFQAGSIDPQQAMDSIAVQLHDHIGDAKMIALDKVSGTAADLEKLVHLWNNRLLPGAEPSSFDESMQNVVYSQSFRTWLDRLMTISKQFAVSLGDSGQVKQIQALRMEISKALQRAGGRTSRHLRRTSEMGHFDPRRVLLLDDSAISRKLLARTLEEMGHVVTSAATAPQFWRLLAEFAPHVVFLDINMPDVKGDEVCRRVRKTPGFEQLPVFIFSSLSDEELLELSTRSGASGYVSKQHGLERLREYVQELSEKGVL